MSELVLVTVNAHQHAKDVNDGRLSALAEGISSRVAGGSPPDVVVCNEMHPAQFHKLIAELSGGGRAYAAVEPSGKGRAKAIVNTGTVAVSKVAEWSDLCEANARFQIAGLELRDGGKPFTVAAVHLSPHYDDPGKCRRANLKELRRQLAGVQGPVLIAGDFNKRAMTTERECDLEEMSKTLPWWGLVTERSSEDGRSFRDAVRHLHKEKGLALKDQWTTQQNQESVLCDGTTGHKRGRIDYIFASSDLEILEATADHPGWAEDESKRYSDHRFAWGRFTLP